MFEECLMIWYIIVHKITRKSIKNEVEMKIRIKTVLGTGAPIDSVNHWYSVINYLLFSLLLNMFEVCIA